MQSRTGSLAVLLLLALAAAASATSAAAEPTGGSDDVGVRHFQGSSGSDAAWRMRPTGGCMGLSCGEGLPVEDEHDYAFTFAEEVHTVVWELVYERDHPLSQGSLHVWCERDDVPRDQCTFTGTGEYQRLVTDISSSTRGNDAHQWFFDFKAAPRSYVAVAPWAEAAVVYNEQIDLYVSTFSGDAHPDGDYTAVPQ